MGPQVKTTQQREPINQCTQSKWNVLNAGLILQTWCKPKKAQLKLTLLVLVLPIEKGMIETVEWFWDLALQSNNE